MSFNGSGTFTLVAGNPVVTNTTVSSTVHNNTMSDIASALSNVICKDGQTSITANIPLAGYKLTGIGAATAAGDAVRYEQLFTSGTVTLLGALTLPSPLTVPAGSVTAASVAVGVADTGLYSAASDTVSITADGAEQVRFAAGTMTLKSAVVVADTGAQIRADDSAGVGAPALSFDGDTNTGIYRVSADTLGIAVGGAKMGQFSSTGFLVGTTTAYAVARVQAVATSGFAGSFDYNAADTSGGGLTVNRASADGAFCVFYRGGAEIGSISASAGTTSFNTTSDGRLKENVKPIERAGEKIDAIAAVEFDWKGKNEKGFGFVAQDLYEVFPGAVTPGDPDYEDDPENKRPWMVDYSKIVPYIVAEVQELRRRVSALEQK